MGAEKRHPLRAAIRLAIVWLVLGFTVNAVMVVAASNWGSTRWTKYRNSVEPAEYGILLEQGWLFSHVQIMPPEPRFAETLPQAPHWVGIKPESEPPGLLSWSQFAAGWPMRSTSGFIEFDGKNFTHHGFWRVPGLVQLTHRKRGMPIIPIWPGLIANTLILGAPALLLLFVPGMRRARRRKRGKCPWCAYDLNHDFTNGCSECGWGKAALLRERTG